MHCNEDVVHAVGEGERDGCRRGREVDSGDVVQGAVVKMEVQVAAVCGRVTAVLQTTVGERHDGFKGAVVGVDYQKVGGVGGDQPKPGHKVHGQQLLELLVEVGDDANVRAVARPDGEPGQGTV